MKSKTIAQGAEATLIKQGSKLIKDRTKKSYRHPTLDEKIRKLRTRIETKLLQKAFKIIPTPKVLASSEHTKDIEMEFISGKKLSENLESLDFKSICKQIGKQLALLHNSGIIHGDLTTSNMILSTTNSTLSYLHKTTYPDNNTVKRAQSTRRSDTKRSSNSNKEKQVFFIDYGLGFHSDRVEDKAVDLHLIKQALEAKHHSIFKQAFTKILEGYKSKSNNPKQILTRLEKVERRGRYKDQY